MRIGALTTPVPARPSNRLPALYHVDPVAFASDRHDLIAQRWVHGTSAGLGTQGCEVMVGHKQLKPAIMGVLIIEG